MAVRRLARRVLPDRVRARVARRLSPALTVVLVAEERDAERIGDALAALGRVRAVIVAPVGALACGPPVAGSDVRVLAPAASFGEAVAAGVEACRTDLVHVARACDLPDAAALLDLAAAMTSGDAPAELGVGALRQWGEAEDWIAATTARHPAPGRYAALASAPGVLADASWATKVWSVSLLRSVLPVTEGSWLLSADVARAATRADGVVVTDAVVSTYAAEHGWRAYGATPSAMGSWKSTVRVVDEVAASVEGAPAREWAAYAADVLWPRFLLEAERAAPAEFAEVTARAAAGPEPAGVVARTLRWLAVERGQDAVADFVAGVVDAGVGVPTHVEGSAVLASWAGVDVPREVRLLRADETALRAHAVRAGAAYVDVALAIDRVSLAGVEISVSASVGGREVEAAWRADPYAVGRFDTPTAAAAPGVWRIQAPAGTEVALRVTAGGLERTTLERWVVPQPPRPEASVVVTSVGLGPDGLEVAASGGAERLVDDAGAEVPADRLPASGCRIVDAAGGQVGVAEELRARLPLALADSRARLVLRLGPRGGLVVGVSPALADSEVGPFAQARLQASYAVDPRPLDPRLVYLESYAGVGVTDSPAEIGRLLAARRPDLDLAWGVRDRSVAVPDGARSVLIGSTEWYAVLASARALVVNTDVEPWFRRRPGQFLVQTYHGHPSKVMGRSLWSAKSLRSGAVAGFRRRSAGAWSALLSPGPAMTPLFREQFDWDGPVWETGFPRTDPLVDDDAPARRAAARAALGIREDQTAVLYAPTWREHLATRPRAAAHAAYLDARAAADALGDSHVLLMRGHRFHHTGASGPGVLDVTDHPDVNDLVLAADVAVLDYSSLRFDVGAAGRPMVFLVPDLATYETRLRGFLFPFAESAPGPFVETTAQVVDAVRDVRRLAAAWAEPLAAFRSRYCRLADGHATERVVDLLLAELA